MSFTHHAAGPLKLTVTDSNGTVFEAMVTSYTISIDHKSPLRKFSIEAVEEIVPMCNHKWERHSGLNAIDSTYQGIGQAYSGCKKCGEIK